jgi:hypothetical protein
MPPMTQDSAAWQHLPRLLGATGTPHCLDLNDSIPWPEVLDLAEAHRLGSLLYDAVQQASLAIPGPILRQLHQSYYQVAASNTLRFGELRPILSSFSAAGIPVLLLKGVALAVTVYGNPALRPMGDLDLLVPRHLVREVPRLLEPLGYRLDPGPPGHSLAYAARFDGEIGLSKETPAGAFVLDVHGHLLADQWLHHATRIDMDAVWQAARPIAQSGLSALQLCPQDTLLHLCLHAGLSHSYTEVLNLIDIDRAVVAFGHLDWDRLLRRACDFKVRFPVYFGLRFASDLLGTPVPERVLAALRPGLLRSRIIWRVVAPQRTILASQASLPAHVHHLAHLALVNGLPELLRFARFLLLPGDELRLRYSLTGSGAIRLARIWHPFSVLKRALALLVRSSRRRVGRGSAMQAK